ncbi:hypothetical protein ASPCADRAFT_142531 [Aspergillus carbonarius ITEM 5010]|uniref:Rhodopsin domain-containing protein n=1 Tax=Aspergillus carbonarius (strain ITEM 5010) TaxID=602072 RepID=A0A1R3RV45_ASPC5|nr:hypothetical protein ASPCADRAFT_142531 [Aspergillus carbonarius ITEM 5010]
MASIRDALGEDTGLSHEGRDVAITLAVCLFAATLATGLRFWLSRMQRPLFLTPEIMTLASLLFFYSHAVGTFMILTIGHDGYPASRIQHWRLTFTLKWAYYLRLSYALGLGLVKCSILMTLLRFLAASSKVSRLVVWVIMAFCASWSLVAILLGLLSCRPLSYNWNLKRPDGHCIDKNAVFLAVSILDVATNAAILLVPLPKLVKAKMTRPEKLTMVSVLVTGIFIVVVAVVRTVTIARAGFLGINDNGKMVLIWTTVEWTIAIMVANASVFWPLLDWLTPFHSIESGPCERSTYQVSSHLLGRLQPPNMPECTQTLTTKTTVAETGSIHSSRSIIRGFGTSWSEAIGQAEQPDLFLSLEPGEVRVQTEWSVERSCSIVD